MERNLECCFSPQGTWKSNKTGLERKFQRIFRRLQKKKTLTISSCCCLTRLDSAAEINSRQESPESSKKKEPLIFLWRCLSFDNRVNCKKCQNSRSFCHHLCLEHGDVSYQDCLQFAYNMLVACRYLLKDVKYAICHGNFDLLGTGSSSKERKFYFSKKLCEARYFVIW